MMVESRNEIRSHFKSKFDELLGKEPALRNVIYDLLTEGSAYIIGGYVRDVLTEKESRDVDIVADIPSEKLKQIVNDNNCRCTFNRFGGVKLQLSHTEVDMWNINDNWAFRTELVKLNDNDKLDCIARGCFYNYDALVLNLPKFHYNIRYYNEFMKTGVLQTMQKQPIYKNLNPTVEANIIRSIYIRKIHSCTYSSDLKDYLLKKILELSLTYGDAIGRLLEIKQQYPKYNAITQEDIKDTLKLLYQESEPTLFDEELKRII